MTRTNFQLLMLMVVLMPRLFAEQVASTEPTVAGFETRNISGWTVYVSDSLMTHQKDDTTTALALLQVQLDDIVRVVPKIPVAQLQAVPLWFNPEYPDHKSRAEYHPGVEWLKSQGRSEKLFKGVEFTNIKKFKEEIVRMPALALHELSHAFHDQVLGFNHPEILAAFEKAKASGKYDKVERWYGSGRPNAKEKAYGMSNHKEYFAECTEAFFLRNDFFPFNREELHQHDPDMEQVLIRVWKCEK